MDKWTDVLIWYGEPPPEKTEGLEEALASGAIHMHKFILLGEQVSLSLPPSLAPHPPTQCHPLAESCLRRATGLTVGRQEVRKVGDRAVSHLCAPEAADSRRTP